MTNIEIVKTPLTQLFNAVHFVIQAKAKESTRYALKCIFVSKEYIVATDGKRLHWTTIEHPEWDEGLYDVVKCTQSHIFLKPSSKTCKFPRWQEIVPEHKLYFEGRSLPQIYIGLSKKDIAIDLEFLKKASLDESSKIYIGSFDQPILLKYEMAKCNALIMPIQNIDKIEYIKVPEKPKKKVKKHKK